jgi:glycerol-3-phosphate dehydrogenase
MAQETVNEGIKKCGLPSWKCLTKDLKIHGYLPSDDHSNRRTASGDARHNQQTVHGADRSSWRTVYGSDAEKIQALETETPAYAEKLHPAFDFTVAEVVWAVREEMAITVEDVLSRRMRALILDARASIEMAPRVAAIMARELNQDETWERAQVDEFVRLAEGYLIK